MTQAERLALITMLEILYRHLIGIANGIKTFCDALKGE